MFFKKLKFGKNKKKEKQGTPADASAPTDIAGLEEQLKDRTEDLAQTEMKLKDLSGKISKLEEIEASELQPHGPIGELSTVPEDSLSGVDTDEEEDTSAEPEKKPAKAKVAEAEPESKPSTATKKPDKQLDAESLKALFTSEEEEENPLAGLINSLPDVSVDELMDDLKEIKDIIRDWQNK
jgi:TolA-binding protein